MSFHDKENRPFLGIIISRLFSSVPENPLLPTGEDADKGQLRELYQRLASTDITVAEYIASVLKQTFLFFNYSCIKIYHMMKYIIRLNTASINI